MPASDRLTDDELEALADKLHRRFLVDGIEKIGQQLYAKFRAEQLAHYVEPETHSMQHAFIERWMDRERKREIMREKIKTSTLGWLVMVGLVGLGTLVWEGITHVLRAIK